MYSPLSAMSCFQWPLSLPWPLPCVPALISFHYAVFPHYTLSTVLCSCIALCSSTFIYCPLSLHCPIFSISALSSINSLIFCSVFSPLSSASTLFSIFSPLCLDFPLPPVPIVFWTSPIEPTKLIIYFRYSRGHYMSCYNMFRMLKWTYSISHQKYPIINLHFHYLTCRIWQACDEYNLYVRHVALQPVTGESYRQHTSEVYFYIWH